MFGTHNIALSGNDIYTISSPKSWYSTIERYMLWSQDRFLPNKAIVEMICDIDSDCDSNDIGR
jgi:hypothetical protein